MNENGEETMRLTAEDWQAYGLVYGFVGNELLEPMNRSGRLQGLDPAFWASMPEPDNDLGRQGLAALEAYAQAVAESDPNDPDACGMLGASVEYAHLFIGPPAPVAAPWETMNDPANTEHVGFGRATVAMKRLLAEEGMELAGVGNQYEDHMGVELLYLAALCDRAAQAREAGESARACELAAKTESFLLVHPLTWMGALRGNVDAERPEGYYAALLKYAHGVMEDHAQVLRAASAA